MPEIKLYNTLSGTKEIFKPLAAGRASIYHCGPTVYDFAHIGNLRAYVFADILRRMFEYNGYVVNQVINITDVGHLSSDADEGEDKMTKALRRENKPITLEAMRQVAEFYGERFKDDLKSLNIEMPQKMPRASDHIKEDIELAAVLEKNGFAYRTSDGLYFDTSKFPSYGKLGNVPVEAQRTGSRMETNLEKRNPADFTLWKFDSRLGWNSPWGMGFPGWHIECSAMSRRYLGQPFDIHTGGVDHIPVHHNNEIAQSEAAYGVPLADYWMHSAFLTVDNDKMAKSSGRFLKLSDLLRQSVSPLGYRYWLLTAHYRSPADFSHEAVKAAQTALIRLMQFVSSAPQGGSIDLDYKKMFIESINDDLNTPKTLALVWRLFKDSGLRSADKRSTLIEFDRVLGLRLDSVPRMPEEAIPPEIEALLEARETARTNKDWSKADALRFEIERRGYVVTDIGGKSDIRKSQDAA